MIKVFGYEVLIGVIKELANSITEEEIFTDSINNTASKDESNEEKEHKLHRVILLRSWLLHFIGNVHDYFMTRVLQSTQIGKFFKLIQISIIGAWLISQNCWHRYSDTLQREFSMKAECSKLTFLKTSGCKISLTQNL